MVARAMTTDMADVERLKAFGSGGGGHISRFLGVGDSGSGKFVGVDFLKCNLRPGWQSEERGRQGQGSETVL